MARKGNAKGALDSVGKKLTEADLRAWLTDPEGMREKTGSSRTPAMERQALSTAQIDALVAYLGTLKKSWVAAAIGSERVLQGRARRSI